MGMIPIDYRKLRPSVAHIAILDARGRLDEVLAIITQAQREHRAARADLPLRDRLAADRIAKALQQAFGLSEEEAVGLVESYLANDDEWGIAADILREEAAPLAVRMLQEVST
jgi:hypothetical protein